MNKVMRAVAALGFLVGLAGQAQAAPIKVTFAGTYSGNQPGVLGTLSTIKGSFEYDTTATGTPFGVQNSNIQTQNFTNALSNFQITINGSTNTITGAQNSADRATIQLRNGSATDQFNVTTFTLGSSKLTGEPSIVNNIQIAFAVTGLNTILPSAAQLPGTFTLADFGAPQPQTVQIFYSVASDNRQQGTAYNTNYRLTEFTARSLNAPDPLALSEPGSLAILAVALAGALGLRRQRARSA